MISGRAWHQHQNLHQMLHHSMKPGGEMLSLGGQRGVPVRSLTFWIPLYKMDIFLGRNSTKSENGEKYVCLGPKKRQAAGGLWKMPIFEWARRWFKNWTTSATSCLRSRRGSSPRTTSILVSGVLTPEVPASLKKCVLKPYVRIW